MDVRTTGCPPCILRVPGQVPASGQGQHRQGEHAEYTVHTHTGGSNIILDHVILGLELLGLKPTCGQKPLGLGLGL